MRREREKDKKQRELEENWAQKTREEMIRELYEEEELVKAEKKTNKEERYKEAVRLKRSWREWRRTCEAEGEEEDEWQDMGEEYLAGIDEQWSASPPHVSAC